MIQNEGYIYILKEDTHFALMTMSGDFSVEDYVTLLDYDNIRDINIYFDSDAEKYLYPFDMSKFYKIPVKNSDGPSIQDLLDFIQKEK